MASEFKPQEHTVTLRGGQAYLPVAWRLVWLRTDHPDAIVTTELVDHREGFALFRAQVSIPGGGSATGWGSETSKDFLDYIEKAETKALGRALAALGYGTQFAPELSEGDIVDAAVPAAPSAAPPPSNPEPQITLEDVLVVAAKMGIDRARLDAWNMRRFGRKTEALSPDELLTVYRGLTRR